MTKYKCNTSLFSRNITKNKVYDLVKSDRKIITIINDHGKEDDYHEGYFDLVEEDDYHEGYFDLVEEPVIEVGSEWVANDLADGEGVVKYTSDQSVLIDIVNKDEQLWSHSQFLRTFKPKPKVVTMYFYKDCKGLVHSYSEPMPVFGEHLFTKVIEL